MDEEEELENTLIGQQEEAPAVNTEDAIMGAGIPESAFGQAPAVNPFSMEAARQVNPMMQQQSLEAPAQPQVTFRDYDVPEPPRASALSVFTPGGDLKAGIDVNAITPAPTPTTSTPPVAPSSALLEMLERADERERMGLPRQAAPGILDAPVESLTAVAADQTQAPELDPTSDEAILARRAAREAEFLNAQPTAPRSDLFPNDPGVQRTRDELMRRFGAPTIREIQEQDAMRRFGGGATPAPAAVNNFAPQASGGQAGPTPVLETVPTPRGRGTPVPFPNTEGREIRDALFRGDPGFNVRPLPSEPDAGFTPRPLPNDPPGSGTRPLPNDPASTRPGNVRDMLYRNPVPNLSDFERESLAREARLAERDRLPGETQTERDTRIARSRTQGSSRGGISQADARDLAQGMARGATEGERARALQIQSRLGLGQFEPERELTDLEKREIESQIRAREAGIAAQERKGSFEPRIVTIDGQRAIELSPGNFQQIQKDTPNKTGLQKTLENLQADLDAGRLTQEEYEIGIKNARDLYIRREKPKGQTTEDEFQNIIAGAEAGGASTVDATDAPQVATGRGQARRGRPVETDDSTPPSPVRVNSQAEYDALPVGTPYIDSQGTPGIKK
jgi:hypothetical protein